MQYKNTTYKISRTGLSFLISASTWTLEHQRHTIFTKAPRFSFKSIELVVRREEPFYASRLCAIIWSHGPKCLCWPMWAWCVDTSQYAASVPDMSNASVNVGQLLWCSELIFCWVYIVSKLQSSILAPQFTYGTQPVLQD